MMAEMHLRCVLGYRGTYDHEGIAFAPGDLIDDPELIDFLLRDAPGCFEWQYEIPVRLIEDAPNRMLVEAPNRAMNSVDEPISAGYRKPRRRKVTA